MSNGVNKVFLLGNLGNEPEFGSTQNQRPKCVVNIATGESWKDKQTGEKKEITDWHRVVFFDRLAQVAKDYLHKGSKVWIEGKNKTLKWTDENTEQKRYLHEIHASRLEMLDSKSQEGDYQAPQRQNPNGSQVTHYPAPGDPDDDDIPF